MSDLPFHEHRIDSDTVIRKFSENTDPIEFMWHRDLEDRIITPTHKNNWLFQFDNELPIPIECEIFIPAGSFHRLIKGTGDLILRIRMI